MRLIDAEDYLYRERPVGLSDELYEESHLYKSIMGQEVVQAIPLDKVKQARRELDKLPIYGAKFTDEYRIHLDREEVFSILDKLIAGSEGENGYF